MSELALSLGRPLVWLLGEVRVPVSVHDPSPTPWAGEHSAHQMLPFWILI